MKVSINSKGVVTGIDTSHETVMLLMSDGSIIIKKIKTLKIEI